MKNMIYTLIFIVSFVLVGCEKPNPHPETLDPVYEDLNKELGLAKAAVAGLEKQVEEHKKSMEEAIPQTGQIKYAQKRFFEASAKLDKAKQMVQYYEMRIKSREKWDRTSYMKAYKAKEPWPKPAEFEEYKSQKALEQASRSWNARERVEEAQAELKKSQAPPAGGHGGGGEHGGGHEEAPAAEHGEH